MPAGLAPHVVAALVLLNGLAAAGAGLCVQRDPDTVLALVSRFQLPLPEALAGVREVRLLTAAEAEGLSTLAGDFPGTALDPTERHAVAVTARTPTRLLIPFGVGPC